MLTHAYNCLRRNFENLSLLFTQDCVSKGEGDYSKAVIVPLAQVLAQAEKLPQASLQEEYFLALESCLFCHAG